MSREAHVRFWERLGVRFPRPTRHELHWVLDVEFKEDQSQVRNRRAAENLGLLRRTALSLLRSTPKPKKRMSIKHQRRVCDYRPEYLLAVLGAPRAADAGDV